MLHLLERLRLIYNWMVMARVIQVWAYLSGISCKLPPERRVQQLRLTPSKQTDTQVLSVLRLTFKYKEAMNLLSLWIAKEGAGKEAVERTGEEVLRETYCQRPGRAYRTDACVCQPSVILTARRGVSTRTRLAPALPLSSTYLHAAALEPPAVIKLL